MKSIVCIDYSEQFRVLTIVYSDGEHECYLDVSKDKAWLILRELNRVKLKSAS